MNFSLNPTLDRCALAADYQKTGRADLDDLLNPELVLSWHQHFAQLPDIAWEVTHWPRPEGWPGHYRRAVKPHEAFHARMRRDALAALAAGEYARYLHQLSAEHEDAATGQIRDVLSSPEMVQLMADITGEPLKEAYVPSYYRYSAGCFLGVHRDKQGKGDCAGIKVNSILYLTPGWEESWGGAFIHHDGSGRKEYPIFNRMVVLPLGDDALLHEVEEVAEGAPPRFSFMCAFR